MIDIGLTTWLVAIGIVVLAPMMDRLRWGVIGLALPTGAGVYVAVALAMLTVGIRFSVVGALLASTAIAVAAAAAMGGRRALQLVVRSTPACVTLGATLLMGALGHLIHLTRLTPDSGRYLITANALQTTGSLGAASPWDLRMRQLVTPLLHAGGVVDGAGFSAAITPLFAVSGLAAMTWLAWQAFERSRTPLRTRWQLLGAVGLLLVSTNRFVFHAFYINGHMFFAVFAVVGVGLVVLAAADHDWSLIVPASLALGAIVPLRPEGLITVAVLVVPALGSRSIPYPHRWRLLTPALTTTLLWNGFLWPRYALETDAGVLGPVYGNLVVAAGLATGLGLLGLRRAAGLGRWAPAAIGAVLIGYLAVSAVADPEILRDSLAALGANLAVEGLWGTTWWVLPLLLTAAWLVTASERGRLLMMPIPLFGLALLSFAYLRGGAFRVGTGDSGSRMLVHIVLIAALAVLVTIAELTTQSATDRAETNDAVVAGTAETTEPVV